MEHDPFRSGGYTNPKDPLGVGSDPSLFAGSDPYRPENAFLVLHHPAVRTFRPGDRSLRKELGEFLVAAHSQGLHAVSGPDLAQRKGRADTIGVQVRRFVFIKTNPAVECGQSLDKEFTGFGPCPTTLEGFDESAAENDRASFGLDPSASRHRPPLPRGRFVDEVQNVREARLVPFLVWTVGDDGLDRGPKYLKANDLRVSRQTVPVEDDRSGIGGPA